MQERIEKGRKGGGGRPNTFLCVMLYIVLICKYIVLLFSFCKILQIALTTPPETSRRCIPNCTHNRITNVSKGCRDMTGGKPVMSAARLEKEFRSISDLL